MVDLLLAQSCIFDRLLERSLACLSKIVGEFLKLGPGELEIQVLWTLGSGRDERQW